MKRYLFDLSIDEETLFRFVFLFSNIKGTCFFYSGKGFCESKHSWLFLFPKQNLILTKDPFKTLKQNLSKHFWAGYATYEMGSFSDEKNTFWIKSSLPLGFFQRYLFAFKIHHQNRTIELFFDEELPVSVEEKKWLEVFKNFKQFTQMLSEYVLKKTDQIQLIYKEDPKAFLEKIKKAKEYIFSGDIYQVNLSHELIFQGDFDPFSVFVKTAKANPSPFSAYLYMQDYTIVSTSPERLLLKEKDRLQTKPIKGTITKGKNREKSLHQLISSDKEKAELAMITDLARNDLNRVSLPNTVTTKPFQVEEYETIFHTLSTVEGIADPSIHPVDLFKSCFPGGSITGCPKLRAKEIIYELEQRARHIYTGSMGYFFQDDFDFNIAIRTFLFCKDTVSVQLGSAIVADSDPIDEYHETLQKGKSMFKALGWNQGHELYLS